MNTQSHDSSRRLPRVDDTVVYRSARGTPAPEIVAGEITDPSTTLKGHVAFKAETLLPLSGDSDPFLLVEQIVPCTQERLVRINAGQLATGTDRALFAGQFARGSLQRIEVPVRRWKLAFAATLIVALSAIAALAIGLS